MKNIKQQALDYLSKNYLENIDMIEPIRIDQVEFIYVDDDTVFFKEKRSGVYMINSDNINKATEIILRVSDIQSIRTNLEEHLDLIAEKFDLKETFRCKQCVYESVQKLPLSGNLDMKSLTLEHYPIISENYDLITNEDLKKHLENKELFGGFVHDELVGFIGTHFEGSIGLLFVFPKHRKKGYASELESFMINYLLSQNLVPFAQVKINNHSSFAVQKKLGMTIVEDTLFWAFNA